jgi:serine/threonine-protein kinase
MGDKAILLQTLPPDKRDDVEKAYDEISATQPDPRERIAELHRRGVLDDSQLRKSMMQLEAERRIERVEPSPNPEQKGPTVLGPLGAGAMGEVLLAKDELGRVVAVKKLLPHMMGKRAIARRFFKEAQVTAQLDHPSIVPIYDLVYNEDGSLGYSMKLVRGQTLEDFIDEAGEQWAKKGAVDAEHDLNARLDVFLAVCDAVAYAHQRGVVHRDLKPENVMVGAFGQVIVMDWGIAKLVSVPDGKDTLSEGTPNLPDTNIKKTRVGVLMGTPRYMSPEQAQGKNDVLDARSDQYALGVILQEIVTLQPAIQADLNLQACLAWAIAGKRMPFSVLHRNQPLPKQLVAIVDKACQVDPDKRYASVPELAEDVRRFLRDEPISAMRDSFGDKLGRVVARNRGKVLLLIVMIALLGVAGVGVTGMFGVTALGAAQYKAQQDAIRVTAILNETTEHALEIESAFLKWNGHLAGIGGVVEQALVGGAKFDQNIRVPSPYDPPPGLKKYDRYPVPVSLDYPDLGSATEYDKLKENDIAKQMLTLGGRFRAAFADSAGINESGRAGALRNAIIAGVPIVWADAYAASGWHARYPGREGLKDRRNLDDFTKAPWFRRRQHDRSIRWAIPHVDPDGMGLVVTGYRTLSDNEGDFIGVATIDVSLDWVHDELLVVPDWVNEVWLVNENYEIIISGADDPENMTSYSAELLPEEMRTAVKSAPIGTAVVDEGRLSWARLETTGWTYVMLVDHGAGPAQP